LFFEIETFDIRNDECNLFAGTDFENNDWIRKTAGEEKKKKERGARLSRVII